MRAPVIESGLDDIERPYFVLACLRVGKAGYYPVYDTNYWLRFSEVDKAAAHAEEKLTEFAEAKNRTPRIPLAGSEEPSAPS